MAERFTSMDWILYQTFLYGTVIHLVIDFISTKYLINITKTLHKHYREDIKKEFYKKDN